MPINTGQITNTNRNLSFSTSTPRRPALAARCPADRPPPGIAPDGGGTPEGVVDPNWPLVVVVLDTDPVLAGTVFNPDPASVTLPVPLCVANALVPATVPDVVFAGTIPKSAEYTTVAIGVRVVN